MSTRKIAMAALIVAASAGLAFAQSAPAPANQSGPSVSPTTQSPTDPAVGGQSGNKKGTPERATKSKPSGTTGSGMAPQGKMDRDNTSVPGQGVNKDDTTPMKK